MRKLLEASLLATTAVAVNVVLQGPPAAWAGPAAAHSRSNVEAELQDLLHERLNQIRRGQNLPRLERDAQLTEVARRHSRDMIRNGFFAHNNLRDENSSDRVAVSHRRLVGLVGENLWGGSKYDFLDVPSLADRIVDDLMKSSGHRKNILTRQYTHLGVGAVMEGDEIRVTQVFASVDAFLRNDLPERVRPGQSLDLRMDASGPGGPAVRFDLESLDRRQVLGPFPVKAAVAPSQSGRYRLRFHFPTGNDRLLKVVYGPVMAVE